MHVDCLVSLEPHAVVVQRSEMINYNLTFMHGICVTTASIERWISGSIPILHWLRLTPIIGFNTRLELRHVFQQVRGAQDRISNSHALPNLVSQVIGCHGG